MPALLPFAIAEFSVLQGVQGYQQNQAMAKSVKAQAAANIANEQKSYSIKKSQLLRQQEIDRGKATVAAAGSGATLGSFDTLFDDNASQGLMDQALLEYDSKLTQENIRYNAAVESANYKQAATSSSLKGFGSAFGSLYSSGSLSGSQSSLSLGQTIGSATSSSKFGPFLNYGSRALSGYST